MLYKKPSRLIAMSIRHSTFRIIAPNLIFRYWNQIFLPFFSISLYYLVCITLNSYVQFSFNTGCITRSRLESFDPASQIYYPVLLKFLPTQCDRAEELDFGEGGQAGILLAELNFILSSLYRWTLPYGITGHI